MSYEVITDFRAGLDVRKDPLALPAGALTTLVDGHITAGGEIEKRPAWVRQTGNPSDSPNTLPVGKTFGLQITNDSLYVFGSDAMPTLGGLFKYQRLQHPAVLNGTTYDAAKHAMVSIACSCYFVKQIFAVAVFADGYSFAYWNGSLLTDFTYGLVLPYLDTTAKLSAAITQAINNSVNYTGVQGTAPNDNELNLYSLPGNEYSTQVIVESASNISVTSTDDTDYPAAIVASTNGDNAGDGSTLVIGGKTYTFKTGLSGVEGQVLIGDSIQGTLTNLFNAINHSGTPGTDYYCAAQNASYEASLFVLGLGPKFTITARTLLTAGEIENDAGGATYLNESDTIAKKNSLKATGQFDISMMKPPVAAYGVFTSNGTQPADGTSVTVGSYTYTFKSSPTTAFQVKRGANSDATFDSLLKAINGLGVVGTDVGATTRANLQARASSRVGAGAGATATVTCLRAGSSGNGTAFSTTTGALAVDGSGSMQHGTDCDISSITVGPTRAIGYVGVGATNLSDGDTFSIGGTVYTFKSALTPSDGEILIGATAADTLNNLFNAINMTGVNGVTFYVSAKNAQVIAVSIKFNDVTSLMTLIAILPGADGNLISLVSSTSAIAGATGAMQNGQDAISLLSGGIGALPSDTPATFLDSVVAAINSYSTTSGYSARSSGTTIFIDSVDQNSVSNDATISIVTSGSLCIEFCGFAFSDAGTFGTGGNTAINVMVDGFSILNTFAALTTGGYTTIASFVQALAENINTVSSTLYAAVANGNQLFISRLSTSSDKPPAQVTIVAGNTGIVAVSSIGRGNLVATISPNYVGFVRKNNKTATSSPIVVSCAAIGGYPPYTYSWEYLSGAQGFDVTNQGTSKVTFTRQDNAGSNAAQWVCKVTDSVNTTVQSNPVTIRQP